MRRAVTLIELLTVLAVSVIALYLLSITLFHLPDPIAVGREVELMRAFFHQVQSEARFSRQNYAITLAREGERWCAIAIAKNDKNQTACNCLMLSSCQLNSDYRFYQPRYNTTIKPSKWFPAVLTHIDGKSGNNSGGCVNVIKGSENLILQFQQAGVVNVIQGKTRSNCS